MEITDFVFELWAAKAKIKGVLQQEISINQPTNQPTKQPPGLWQRPPRINLVWQYIYKY